MDIGVKFSKEDFDLFKSECLWWINRFGLNDWEISFIFGVPEARCDSLACTGNNYMSMRATIYFNSTCDSDDMLAMNKEKLIRMCAFHEVFEIVLSPLEHLALQRDWDSEAYESERHRILHRVRKAIDEADRDILREALNIKNRSKS